MNEAWKQERIPDEKNRSVVANNVPITLISVKLDGKSPKVKSAILLFLFFLAKPFRLALF
jgi:hypothetical protein